MNSMIVEAHDRWVPQRAQCFDFATEVFGAVRVLREERLDGDTQSSGNVRRCENAAHSAVAQSGVYDVVGDASPRANISFASVCRVHSEECVSAVDARTSLL